uniref:Uncharacterized protein n=1 Tax=Panagrellus redivivus TaxID=6233 RepID=A0A7E4UZH0_PANRE
MLTVKELSPLRTASKTGEEKTDDVQLVSRTDLPFTAPSVDIHHPQSVLTSLFCRRMSSMDGRLGMIK